MCHSVEVQTGTATSCHVAGALGQAAAEHFCKCKRVQHLSVGLLLFPLYSCGVWSLLQSEKNVDPSPL